MGKFLDIAAAVLCIGAGLYLLQTEPADAHSLFGPLLHGMGVYFIGKGLFVARATHLESASRDRLTQLVELQAHSHVGSASSFGDAPPVAEA